VGETFRSPVMPERYGRSDLRGRGSPRCPSAAPSKIGTTGARSWSGSAPKGTRGAQLCRSSADPYRSGVIVRTSAGAVRGAEVDDGVVAWRGIPYAAAPVGALRFRPPQPPPPWSGVRDALAHGPRAVQPDLDRLVPVADPGPVDEDCLYLNVTAPARAQGAPVLVWIHGGGYQTGSGPEMPGDGGAFVRRYGLVVVTFNYRLGALGFLDVPDEQPTGAHGLHDQIAALKWVRANIAGFGGDPDRVTVFGLSAGAKSVANLLGSPLTRGLLYRAASASGGADHVKSPQQAESLTRRFLKELGTHRVRDVPDRDQPAAARAVDLASVGRRRRSGRTAAARDRRRRRDGHRAARAELRQRGGAVPAQRTRRGRAGRPGPHRGVRPGRAGPHSPPVRAEPRQLSRSGLRCG
jgi:acetyl esterase/lipase